MRLVPVLIATLLAGCAAGDATTPSRRPVSPVVRSAEHGFTVRMPAGWHLTSRTLTPNLSNPVEILSASTMTGVRADRRSCAHVPVGALERMGPRDAFVTVQERSGDPREFPPRAHPFALPPATHGTDAEECTPHPDGLRFFWFGFRDADRGFHVLVVLGREAKAGQARALLDSLRFTPGPRGVGIDPDRAVRFEDRAARLSWVMPVPPWRRYDWRLTSVGGETLALGTFDLARAAPDRNCTPRQAIDAMPADGAFIWLYEADVRTPSPKTFPPGRGPRPLGPRVPYECMGMSRMARWQDHGRAFQAQVYLGPRASPRLRADTRSIVNSIQAR